MVAFRRAIEIKRNTTLYDSFRVILGCSFIDLLDAQPSVNRYDTRERENRFERTAKYFTPCSALIIFEEKEKLRRIL